MTPTLDNVKAALGITGTYLDTTLEPYRDEVIEFLKEGGVSESNITCGVVARGISDLWNYGSAGGKFSEYFLQRAAQLAYK